MKIPPLVLALLVSASSFTQAALVAITSLSGGSTFPSFNGSNMTIGWSFTANDAITVTDLGFWDQTPASNLAQTHEVGLWTDTGTLLASATVLTDGTLLGSFRYTSIAPLQLTAGSSYLIGAAITSPFSDNYVIPASVTTDAAITLTGSARNGSSGGFSAPTTVTAGTGRLGPNFLFDVTAVNQGSPIPEPTTALFGAALVGVCGLTRRRRTAASV